VVTRTAILQKYTQVDPQGMVTRGLLEDALEFYDINKAVIANQAYIVVVDFSLFSGTIRFWLVDMTSGQVEPHMVAHGQGSDPNDTGYATIFSNTPGSYMSSLGFYLGGEIYDGTHPHSMRLDGLSPDGSPNDMANTNVRSRDVVMHEATYVSDSNTSAQGRSDGCLALDPNIELSVVNKLTGGALIYAEKAPLNPPIGQVMSGSSSGSSSGSGSDASAGSSSGGSSGGSSSGSGSGSGSGGPGGSSGTSSGGSTSSSGSNSGSASGSGAGSSSSSGASNDAGDSYAGSGDTSSGSGSGCTLSATSGHAGAGSVGLAAAVTLTLALGRRRRRHAEL
jgi:hypothetical protein